MYMHIAHLPDDIVDKICFINKHFDDINYYSKLPTFQKLCIFLFRTKNQAVQFQLEYLSSLISRMKYVQSFNLGIHSLTHPLRNLCKSESRPYCKYHSEKKIPIYIGDVTNKVEIVPVSFSRKKLSCCLPY